MIRRCGEQPLQGQRYTLRPGVYAILPFGDRFLLTGQIGEELDVQLPGGGIDPGEQALAALHREVLEETGWRISRPRRLGAFRRFAFMPEYDLWAEKLCTIYVARPIRQITQPSEPDHVSLMLTGAQAQQALGSAGDRLFMSRYLRQQGR